MLSILGVGRALAIAPLYGLVVLAGSFFDVVVYTLWLKRRTCWSIAWGGISGAMPILSGRVLAAGQIDLVGILLAFSVLFWIPTHILTFSIKYREEYARAGVSAFPSTYGDALTRAVIAISSVLASSSIGWASVLISLSARYLCLLAVARHLLHKPSPGAREGLILGIEHPLAWLMEGLSEHRGRGSEALAAA